jgi:very-short-patch-repair endonuclease
LPGKQLAGVQFYRQKPIGNYIVDFYAPKAKLVIEIDGSQHLEAPQVEKDRERDEYLGRVGLMVLRFNSRQVLKETEAVVELIYQTIITQTTQTTE